MLRRGGGKATAYGERRRKGRSGSQEGAVAKPPLTEKGGSQEGAAAKPPLTEKGKLRGRIREGGGMRGM